MSQEFGAIQTEYSTVQKWPKLELNHIQNSAWLKLRSILLWSTSTSALADIFMSMMCDKDHTYGWFTDKIDVAATDDKIIYFNPNTFFVQYVFDEQIFITCHEILHAMYNHCGMKYIAQLQGYILYSDGVKIPYDDNIMQQSMDCLINDTLVESKIGQMPKDAWHMPSLITFNDDLYTAYRKMYELQKGKQGKGGSKKSQQIQQKQQRGQSYSRSMGSLQQNGKSFDQHLAPGTGRGKTPNEAQAERKPQEWDNAIRQAMEHAKRQGYLPAALECGMSQLLESKIDWRDHIFFEYANKVGGGRSTWEHLDPELMVRGIGAPGRKKYVCELVVLVGDSSGSINQTTANMFFGEMAGIIEHLRPREIIFMQCDAQIYDYTEIEEPEELVRPIQGGGGTSFIPPFERVAREGLQPDTLIYLTDLEGTFPPVPPSYPVIWATIRDHDIPWGTKVLIPEQD